MTKYLWFLLPIGMLYASAYIWSVATNDYDRHWYGLPLLITLVVAFMASFIIAINKSDDS